MQFSNVGEKITYTITVENTGNVTLANVIISDVLFPGEDRTVIELAPGDHAVHTLVYTVLQSDIDGGHVLNTARVTAMDPGWNPLPSMETEIEIPSVQGAALQLTKKALEGNHSKVGDVIEYEIILTNTGNVTIKDIQITDDNADSGSISPSAIATLEPGKSVNITAKHTITQADMDRGAVYNIATASGKDPEGKEVKATSKDGNPLDPTDPTTPPVDPDCPTCTVTPIELEGSMTLTKTAKEGIYEKVGDVIEYEMVLTNTGRSIIKDIQITDSNADMGSVSPASIASLESGKSVTIMAKHTITQEDMDIGAVYNVATAIGKDPRGKDVKATSRDGKPVDPTDPTAPPVDPDCPTCTVTPIGKVSKMSFTKTAKAGTSHQIGDAIEYELVLTNIGNVTLRDILVKDDNADVGSLSITRIDRLEPGESVFITARHTITQEDKNLGYVYNIATAKGKDPLGKDVEVTSKDSKPVEPGTPVDPNCPSCTITPIEEGEFKIPNVFTPNGDGRNDTFVILGLDGFDNAELTVFNRWGNEVYRNRNYKNNWDGNNLNEGTYYYLIVLKKAGKESVHKGWVLLKR